MGKKGTAKTSVSRAPDPQLRSVSSIGGGVVPAHALVRVCRLVGGTLNLATTLRAAMDATAEALAAEACSILLYDPQTHSLQFHLVQGDRSEPLVNQSLPVNDASIAGWVANHRTGSSVPDAHSDPRFNPEYDHKTGFHTRSILCMPMLVQDRLVGVVQVLNRRDGRPFSATDRELIEAVSAVVALAVDDAAQYEARVRAERLAAVGQAIAGMAHFIKNILNGLEGGVYLIDRELRKTSVNDRFDHGWQMVGRNLRVLRDVVLDMLTYSKPRKPRLEPTDIRTVCQDILDLTAGQARDAGVELELDVADAIKTVQVDKVAIRRCLLNLVGNAVDACREKGDRVALRLVPAETMGRYVISVSDNGCGMPDDVRRRIFEPLFSTKGSGGTGLGLAVSHKIVQEHGGVLAVESTEGEGTAFILELPVGEAGTVSEM